MMSRVAQAIRLAEVLTMPGALPAFLRSRHFSSSAFVLARDLRVGCGVFGTVIDVGANAGQFSLAVARENPAARVVALEPLPDVAATLRRQVAGHDNIRVVECAAGAERGARTMHRHAYTLSSSLLPTSEAFVDVFPGAARHGGSRPVTVEVVRLDDLVEPAELVGPVLLKLDVQGFEIEALRGAPQLLGSCDWVLAEAATESVYDGEPLFPELYEHMRSVGFVFDRPLDLLRGARGTVSQMDVLFRRAR